MIKQHISALAIALTACTATIAQDTVWVSKYNQIIPSGDSAASYQLIIKDKADTSKAKVLGYSMDGTLEMEVNYQPYHSPRTLHGVSKTYKAGKLKDERLYSAGKLNGHHLTYWENGNRRRDDVYENGEFKSGQCYTAEGKDTTWFVYHLPAEFPGGLDSLRRYMSRMIKYPPKAMHDGIQGNVHVTFSVSKEGAITNAYVRKSIHPLLDAEAMRVVKRMPQWTPGKLEGLPATTLFTLPVNFRLE